MANWLIIFVAIVYLYVSGDLVYHGKYGMGLAFLAYSIANVGFYLANKGY